MESTNQLISQLVKVAKPAPTKKEATLYGTVHIDGGVPYVRLDGSELYTPVVTTAAVSEDERVTVMIKDHSAVITGNITEPSAKESVQQEHSTAIVEQDAITDYVQVATCAEQLLNIWPQLRPLLEGKVNADELIAVDAVIGTLETGVANIGTANVEDLHALSATVDDLYAKFAQFDTLEADEATITYLTAANAAIDRLQCHTGSFMHLTAQNLTAIQANVQTLQAKLANIAFANIENANIDNAWINRFYAVTGMVNDITIENGVVVKELVGVTVSADSIKTGTLSVDRLIVRGDDGLYYKLNVSADGTKPEGVTDEQLKNGLHGSNIIAKTITAEKLSVSELTAFASRLANFKIDIDKTTRVGRICSENKDTIDGGKPGIYMDSSGQMNVGDGTNFIKMYKDGDEYKLEIAASNLKFQAGGTYKSVGEAVSEAQTAANTAYDKVGSRGDQLVTNGSGLMGDNTNFSQLVFDGSQSNSSPGSFTNKETDAGKYLSIFSDELFAVDPNKEYTLSLDAKTAAGNLGCSIHGFLNFYDSDKKRIIGAHHAYVADVDTTTTLAQDLNKGDTVVYLTDASKWLPKKTSYGFYAYQIRFWGYTNSQGYTYPTNTYTQNYANILRDADGANTIDYENNTITLASAWGGGTIKAGTEVSQGVAVGTYKYAIAKQAPPTIWKSYSGKYSGVDYSGRDVASKFPPGTAYASVGLLWNYDKTADQMWVTNISVKETSAATAAANAHSLASAAGNVANSAKTTATNAQSTANSAQTTATNAQTTATNAQSTANQVQSDIDNLSIGARNLIRNSATLIYDKYGFRGVTFTAEIIDGVLTIGPDTSGTAEIIDNVLVVTGNATASIENSILIVK